MTCGLLHIDGCVVNAWDAVTGLLFGWLWAIPWGWFIAGLIIGAILGAQFGWLAVISLGTSVLLGLAGPRVLSQPTDIEGPDAEPSPPRPAPRQRRRLRDLFKSD